MNNSTENVTLFALFINDILRLYKEADPESYNELYNMAKGYHLEDPFAKVPMKLYNDMCQFVQENLGAANLKKIGENIGESVYEALTGQKLVPANPTPKDILNGLIGAAANMVQDPQGRGWIMVSDSDHQIIMKRTQTFNSILQFGLLKGLVKKTGKTTVDVKLIKSVEAGDEFDEYLVTW
ncbi:MAG: hypothetical protein SFY32_13235 [Bacteroidota bacterium]|nr:hypothetical protein [Bacteroidota bacterium]